MPLYEHFCSSCHSITEDVCKIADRKQFIPCKCGGSAERIISASIQRIEPTWLESAKRQLRTEDHHQITDRQSLQRYMRREGIEQVG